MTEEKEPIHFPYLAVATAPDGGFVIASPKGLEDLLIQWFGANGLEAGDPVHIHAADFLSEDGEEHERVDGLDLAFDDQENLLLVWRRQISSLDADKGSYDALYGQYFGGRAPLRDPFPVKGRSAYNSLLDPDVFLGEEGVFMVSWKRLLLNGEDGSLHVNGWRWAPVGAGTFVSEVFDTGPAGADFEQLFWTGERLFGATAVQFQVRTGVDPADLDQAGWYGPQDGSEYYTSSGQAIHAVHDGDRLVQYKASFTTENGETPILHDVGIAYSSGDRAPPARPTGFSATPGHSQVLLAWEPNTEADLLEYRLYRGAAYGDYDSTWTKHLPLTQTAYPDTSAQAGTTYFYAIAAVDLNLNEGRTLEEVSATPFGQNWYVDASNSGAGDGSPSAPFSRINDALARTIYGDTVRVAAGTYKESVAVRKGVALVGEGHEVCSILNPDDQDHWSPPVVGISDRATLQGFTIHQRYGRGADAVQCGGSSFVSHNKIMAVNHAVVSRHASPVISDNIITSTQSGISVSGGTAVVLRNIITGVNIGIDVNSGSRAGPTVRVRIQNNILSGIGIRGIYGSHRDIEMEIVNNTIYMGGSGHGAATIHRARGRDQIMNNIVVQKGRGQNLLIHEMDHYELSHNDIWGAGEFNYGSIEPGPGDISADPLFVNPEKGDFRLRLDSPCRDAGHPSSAWNDRDGSRNDMGAYGGPDPIRIGTYHPKVALAVPPASGAAGDTLRVPIQLDNAAGLAEVGMEFVYDPALLRLLRVGTGELTSGFRLLQQVESDGAVSFALGGDAELETGQGAIAELVLVVAASAPAGAACALEIRALSLRDGAGLPIEIGSLTDGAFVVIEEAPSEGFLYVDQSHSGPGDGGWSTPFTTIGEAMAAASPGDTLQVAAGIYRERVMMREGVFLRGSGPLVSKILVEEDSEEHGSPAMGAVVFHNISRGGIAGFEIHRQCGNLLGGATLESVNSSPWITRNRILSCEGRAPDNSAIWCRGVADSRARIEENLIEVGSEGTGIWCMLSDPLIAGNRLLVGPDRFEGIFTTGIFCNAAEPLIVGNRLRQGEEATGIAGTRGSHPTIVNNDLAGNRRSTRGITATRGASFQASNNIIRGHKVAISRASEETGAPTSIENNIIWDNESGLDCKASATDGSAYNLFWNNRQNYNRCAAGEGAFDADPLFRASEGEDFHLQSASPAIDAGNPDPQYDDLDGSRNDMGLHGGPYAGEGRGFAAAAKLSLPDTSAAAGDTLVVPVEALNTRGVARAKMALSYPAHSLTMLDVRTTEISQSFSLTTEYPEPGQVRILLAHPQGRGGEEGTLLDLVVALHDSVQVGASQEIRFGEVALLDELAGEMVVADTQAGTVRIVAPTLTPTAVEETSASRVPLRLELAPSYPNPFNPSTIIPFTVPELSSGHPQVDIAMYDLLGQKVRTLVSKAFGPGTYSTTWDGRDDAGHTLATGVYLCRMQAGRHVESRKLLLLR